MVELGPGIETVKTELRARFARLPPPGPETRASVVEHVSGWLSERGPNVVVGFLAMGEEIDMTPLVDRHPEIRFALTRTAPGTTLTVHPFEAPRETHRFGFEQPGAEAETIDPAVVDVVLVPGVAFTRSGRRLGRGAGYYDRFLSSLSADLVALTVEQRVTTHLPVEPHDVMMDWIATERGIARATT